ncbi:potassium/sodium hyperpolarization-activated cyclic nucleotide-gated channel 1-like [Rhinatrema bivittatum]|uniref:potassium/sodium hyperpolarization-activated cyclic nucleotide-gated channel 1-like n=1 Tax=Rhinatrema bivittatum TaxID=194408 RepID=UPI0011269C9D|nr:potassium/sodium hyperpolarization-activated cyclic nucleotide-gated channel 1-like [Rhinatrema bivittatum]
MQEWTKYGINAILSLIYLFCLIILIWHWNSCLQFLIQKLLNFPENGWVHDEELEDKSIGYKYSFSLLRTLSHMNTLGYGTSKVPKGIPETWLVSISVLTGTALHILLVSRMTAVAASSNGSKRVYQDKYDECKIYLHFRRLPHELRCRVLEHLHNKFKGKWFDERKILEEISESLRLEVMTHSCRDLLLSVPWFVKANNIIINSVMKELKYEVFQMKDTIFRKGAIGNKMYIIERGVVVIEDADSEKKLTKGNYFGETCLIGDRMRSQTARAITPCRMYSLSLESLKSLIVLYPSLKKNIEQANQEDSFQEGSE